MRLTVVSLLTSFLPIKATGGSVPPPLRRPVTDIKVLLLWKDNIYWGDPSGVQNKVWKPTRVLRHARIRALRGAPVVKIKDSFLPTFTVTVAVLQTWQIISSYLYWEHIGQRSNISHTWEGERRIFPVHLSIHTTSVWTLSLCLLHLCRTPDGFDHPILQYEG